MKALALGRAFESRRSLAPCGTLLALVALVILAARAEAAFELRDPSPAALGASSIDVEAPAFFDAAAASPVPALWRGLSAGASHAGLYGVEGYAADLLRADVRARPALLSLSYLQVGGAGAWERSARATLREGAPDAVALEVSVERLALSVDGEPTQGGWSLGGGAESRVALDPVALVVRVLLERAVRTESLDALGVEPSIVVAAEVRSRAARVAFLDRWEGGGRRSPRVLLDVPLAGAAVVRFSRGESPSRTGAALALRAGRLEAAAGRLDLAWGGAIAGFSLTLLPDPKGWGTW